MIRIAQAELEVEALKSGKSSFAIDSSVKLIRSPGGAEGIDGRIEPTINLETLGQVVFNGDLSESLRREANIAKAILIAEDTLRNDQQEPPKEPVEEDWLYSWREYAGKVSSVELQNLWGRVLAGEVKQPGTYSIRTLEFLKGLSKSEALLISKVARFVVVNRVFRNKEKYLEPEGITFSQLLFLQDIGVMSGVEAVGMSTTISSRNDDKFYQVIVAKNKAIMIEHEDKNKSIKVPVYLLTQVGSEVLKLASFDVHQEYFCSIAEDFAKQGYRVHIADWVQQTPEYGSFFNPIEIKSPEQA